MQPVTKLVRQIREALASRGRNAPLESLAAEFARFGQEANQRLESCVAMLEKGSEYQALQLAETEPVLLDFIAELSFAEAPEWAEFCSANDLPTPAKFHARSIQALDGLYAKGISVSHPLYREYRAAVTSRDDGKAIQIIRSIERLNPDDANAKSELARIENKLFQLKIQELRTALPSEDENAILGILSEMERLAPPARLVELPEYLQGGEIRAAAARREAMLLAERLVGSLEEERQADAWRMAGDILARVRSLQSEYGFQLAGQDAAKCAEIQDYCDTKRAEAEEIARFEQALAELALKAEALDSRLLTRPAPTLPDARILRAEFQRHWKAVEDFRRPVPERFVQRVRSTASLWQAEIGRLERQRKTKIVAACAAALAIVGVGTWLAVGALWAGEYVAQLGALRQAGQVETAEKMAASIRKEHPALAAKPKLGASLDATERWTRAERTRLADVDRQLNDLESKVSSGLDNTAPMELATALESTSQLIDGLAGGLREAPAGRMMVVRKQIEAHFTTLREKLVAKSEEELTALESLAGTKLGYDREKEGLEATLAELEPPLKSLEGRATPAVAALELPSAQRVRVEALRRRVDLFRDELGALAKVNEALAQATTLDAYYEALGGYKSSRLVQTREVSEARKRLADRPKLEDSIASLLLPDDPAAWEAAKADVTGPALTPDTILPGELEMLVALRDDSFLNDVWEVTFADLRKHGERREVYARGELTQEGPNDVGGAQTTRWVGDIFDPNTKSEPPAFVRTTYTAQRSTYGVSGDGEVIAKRLSAPSESFAGLELNRMTDATGSKFERPLLGAFDVLTRDKSAGVIFQATLMQKLGSLLALRPYAWGLEYCPSLRNDLADLNRLCGGEMFRTQDWLSDRKKAQFGAKLTPFFNGLPSRNYVTEARLNREVVRRVLKAGLEFGGYVDAGGQAHLLGEARGKKSLWTLAPEGQTLRRFSPAEAAPQNGAPATSGFSPIYFVPLDRDALLSEIGRQLGIQPADLSKPPTLPWLQNP